MRYINIFLLFFQHVTNFRTRIFIWFITSFLNPISLLIFWIAVFKEKGEVLTGWSLSSLSTYYFLIIIAAAFIIVHIEEDVAIRDIREGGLIKYLLKPFSYYWMKFFDEIPWRIIQGFFGLVAFTIFYILLSKFITLPHTFFGTVSTIVIVFLALFISFTFKMIIGLSAFWFVDFWGLSQIVEVVTIILAGLIMPIEFFPQWLKNISIISPFPYMVYYPILSFQSKLVNSQVLQTILIQVSWLVILYLIYRFLWFKGLKKFTGVGQ